MKIKLTFITNSSSASFTILKEKLTNVQIALIYEHIEVAYAVNPEGKSEHGGQVHYINNKIYPTGTGYYDEWKINETKETISGYTSMDNFNMAWYLKEVVGVREEDIDYDNSY